MTFRIAAFACCTVWLTAPLAFADPTTCPPVIDGTCPVGTPSDQWCPEVMELSCPTGKGLVIVAASAPPPVAYTDASCMYTGGGYHCEAWPKKAGVTYAWSKFGMLNWVTTPYGADHADLSCTPGGNNRVYLTVTSPYGLSTTTVTNLYCGASGEY